MRLERLTPVGIMVRFFTALLLVYATFNPEGVSFFHWAVVPLTQGAGMGSVGPVKVVAGILLLIGWLVFLQATRRSLGILGSLLVLALGTALVWLLVDWHVLPAWSTRAIVHIALVIISLVLAIGLSWSSVSRRITGQLDTDQVG
ncbi:MAG: DUF6524 family protein [Gemmatimonadales bacterium]